MDTLVVGVGNPILSDDGVGVCAARVIRGRIADSPGVEVTELAAGGLRLMERMAGYRRAIILDALVSGTHPAGTVVEVRLEDIPTARNLSGVHDATLPLAIAAGRVLGMPLPEELRIFGVEAQDVETFGEVLSEPVAAAIPTLVEMILALLTSSHGGERAHRGLLL